MLGSAVLSESMQSGVMPWTPGRPDHLLHLGPHLDDEVGPAPRLLAVVIRQAGRHDVHFMARGGSPLCDA